MSLLWDCDNVVLPWVQERLPTVNFGRCCPIGVLDNNNKLIAGVVYHSYAPEHEQIEVSIAADSPMWARKNTIRHLLMPPFESWGCFSVLAVIKQENDRARRVCKHVGFQEVARIPHAFGRESHATIYQMTQPEYREHYGFIR